MDPNIQSLKEIVKAQNECISIITNQMKAQQHSIDILNTMLLRTANEVLILKERVNGKA